MSYVLVTGGAGYIGSHTVHELVKAHKKVIIIDDLSTGFKENIHPEVIFEKGSVLDLNFLENVFKKYDIHSIVHFAAKLIVPESVEQPLMYYENNVLGAIQVLKCCQKFNVKNLIFSSTAATYGDVSDNLIKESSSSCPINPYGQSKLFVEKIIQDFAISVTDFRFVILRYFNVAGANYQAKLGQRSKAATHLIKVASEAAVGKRKSVGIFGQDYATEDGTGVRDYIHVIDLATAHLAALEYLQQGGSSEIMNCGYGQGYSVKQVLEVMLEVSAQKFEIAQQPRREGDPARLVADNSKILKLTNWRPQHNDIKEICRSAYLWEQSI